ncbi:DUF4837 family protein [Aquimarina brevivitae]|uniref:Uncharacterized protein DUF4837 n=1 Tax=Aquimarina brevivitae TaxID=323412 RepID=A0A4Q7PFQ7_9FLAO|nr:DUF4837 family protein [Aquimarina brevivitae]RZS99316.1 uncharacterized protein DUF4837 [Aquimarina brevivitae]
MKKIILVVCCAALLIGCKNEKKDKTSRPVMAMAKSVGKINEVSVVIDPRLWKGNIGDTIRKYLAAEVPGLPQEEPLFSLRQMPEKTFTGFATKNRTFLKVHKGSTKGFQVLENKYANPQIGFVVTGETDEEIASVLRKNAAKIITRFKNIELAEKQSRIKKSLEKIPQLEEKMGITMDIPSAYRIAIEEEDFFWVRKDIEHGSMNIMIYEVPLQTIQKDSNTIGSIIKMRDSVGSKKIPTDSGNFITEEAYAPYLYQITIDDRFTYETKGTWEIKDRFMAGPFVNYAIEDKKNNRYVVVEGFVFAPSTYKRDNMFELEAIIETLSFK